MPEYRDQSAEALQVLVDKLNRGESLTTDEKTYMGYNDFHYVIERSDYLQALTRMAAGPTASIENVRRKLTDFYRFFYDWKETGNSTSKMHIKGHGKTLVGSYHDILVKAFPGGAPLDSVTLAVRDLRKDVEDLKTRLAALESA